MLWAGHAHSAGQESFLLCFSPSCLACLFSSLFRLFGALLVPLWTLWNILDAFGAQISFHFVTISYHFCIVFSSILLTLFLLICLCFLGPSNHRSPDNLYGKTMVFKKTAQSKKIRNQCCWYLFWRFGGRLFTYFALFFLYSFLHKLLAARFLHF